VTLKRLLMTGAFMLASFSTAQALECQRELPKDRHGHWAYRIIDGRTCWYAGKSMLSKSLLHWRADARLPEPAAKPTNTIAVKLGNEPDPDSCCWPPLDHAESFESRWWGPQIDERPRP
jgi:hypothetical protein